jgi:hypothetical protein
MLTAGAPAPASLLGCVAVNRAAIEDVIRNLRQWADAYPEEMFRPPTASEIASATKAFPGLVDKVSAAMGRHVRQRMREYADTLEKALGEEDVL